MVLSLHALALAAMSLFRVIEYSTLSGLVTQADASVARAFLNGVWFDNVIACYITALPLAVLSLASAFGYTAKWLRQFALVWYCVFVSIALMASAANIPYFAYFFKNINSSIFEWFGYAATTAGMLWQEKTFWIYIACYFLVDALYIWLCIKVTRAFSKAKANEKPFAVKLTVLNVCVALTLVGACAFGIRGRRGYNPIKISEAYYCQDPFLNQLGINPAFNLLTSVLDDMRKENKSLTLMNDKEALANARKYLGVDYGSEITRVVKAEGEPKKYNVVFILMESMSANLMRTFGNKDHLTPTLDGLYNHSLAFENCFSAGIHTNHGITASLYSFPALMFRNLMKGTVTPHRYGLPSVLKDNGYHNLFFMTHEAQYDNMKAFLTTNGYDDIYSQETYPKKEVVNSFGVSDHYLFNFALDKIDHLDRRQPFMATLLTISNHPPYIVPDFFKPKTEKPETQIVEYADWCIGDFLKKASRRPWYKNIIFVLVADHGKMVGNTNVVLPPSYNHVPLIIFGADVPIQRNKSLALQIDIMPTVLGLLNMSYEFNGFGVDLLSVKRDKVFYSADNQIIGRDSAHCYIYAPKEDREFVYDVNADWSMSESQSKQPALKHYAFSMIQAAQYLLNKHYK